jgi:hypothetical protein
MCMQRLNVVIGTDATQLLAYFAYSDKYEQAYVITFLSPCVVSQ